MRAIADYLYAGRALGGKTMFRDIIELDPGCSVTIDRRAGTVDIRKYWTLQYDYNRSRTDAQTLEQLAAIVDESVAIHCRSDAPLGCHLSGGIDSSSVVAMAARHRQHLSTFSIKFSEDEHIDETRFAKAVAAHVGAGISVFSDRGRHGGGAPVSGLAHGRPHGHRRRVRLPPSRIRETTRQGVLTGHGSDRSLPVIPRSSGDVQHHRDVPSV
jgi:hypothetical protein